MAQFGNRPDNANERATSRDILHRRGRKTVTFQQRSETVNAVGDIEYGVGTTVSRRCNAIHLAGDEVQEQMKIVGTETHWVTVRHVPGRDSTWQAEIGGETYGIVSVQDVDGMKRVHHVNLKKSE